MRRTLIIADDLSGAADCAAAAGPGGIVSLRREQRPEGQLVAVDLDSRAQTPDVARQRAFELAHAVAANRDLVLYQKMDSTLRGNWAVELAGLREGLAAAGRRPLALVAPALPEKGRAVRGGEMFVDGERLAETALWRATGLAAPSMTDMLHRAGVPARVLPAGADADALAEAAAGADVLVCDTRDRADMDRLAASGTRLARDVLWVGSSGLMRSLARWLGPATAPATWPLVSGPIGVIVGSASALAAAQAAAVRREPGVVGPSLSAEALLSGDRAALAAADAEMQAALMAGGDILVAPRAGGHVDLGRGAALTAALAAQLEPLLPRFGGLVLTGGETARAMLERLGVEAIRLCGEVEAGVPLGVTIGRREVPVVTKAGAFGEAGTLVAALRALRARRR